MNTTTPINENLAEAWQELLQANPRLRIRDAADKLGVSEVELLATKTGEKVIRLQGPWPDLVQRFKALGRVMSLTRNDSCVLEHKGTFQKIEISQAGPYTMAAVVGPIESRVFFYAWHTAFAVVDEQPDRVLKSIQVFDRAGEAVTKIYLQDESKEEEFEKIIADFRAPEQFAPLDLKAWPAEQRNSDVDVEALLSDWSELKDTHDFFGMLRKHKVTRYQGIELADGKFSYRVDAQAAPKEILDQAAASKFPIMIFAGNRGNIQIHQGRVKTIRLLKRGEAGQEWLNVLDPDFNMHLRMDLVDSAWVVRKPTSDGDVTSVELFDREQQLVAQFYGLRKPGIPEREGWRELVKTLGTVTNEI